MTRFDGKVVIVTGSTKGIGRQIARRFAMEGGRVVVTGRSKASGEEVAESIGRDGGDAIYVEADLAHQEDIARLVDETVRHFGQLDVVVNNAAPIDLLATVDVPICDEDMEDFESMMRVGLYAPVCLVKLAIPHMVHTGGGAIVNISTAASLLAVPGMPAYACSKALNAFTRVVAADYGQQGIRSNAIIVGPIVTEGVGGAALRHPRVTAVFEEVLLSKDGAYGGPDDVAEGALYLASDQAKYVNGILLPVDGGMTCRSSLPDVFKIFREGEGPAAIERDRQLVAGGQS
ncbi:MAG: SDR family NAD(P)-dependent oxidoreductase [Actinomycetota bacterium]